MQILKVFTTLTSLVYKTTSATQGLGSRGWGNFYLWSSTTQNKCPLSPFETDPHLPHTTRVIRVKPIKLTTCSEGEFTCNDGHCITIEQRQSYEILGIESGSLADSWSIVPTRCDQTSNCLDESDEDNCKLLSMKVEKPKFFSNLLLKTRTTTTRRSHLLGLTK